MQIVPFQVLSECILAHAQTLCSNNSTCFGVEVRPTSPSTTPSLRNDNSTDIPRSTTNTCTLYSSGVGIAGGGRYANSTVYVKAAAVAAGAAEACLLNADAHAMIMGTKPMVRVIILW
jgi:hypothetical protein